MYFVPSSSDSIVDFEQDYVCWNLSSLAESNCLQISWKTALIKFMHHLPLENKLMPNTYKKYMM